MDQDTDTVYDNAIEIVMPHLTKEKWGIGLLVETI